MKKPILIVSAVVAGFFTASPSFALLQGNERYEQPLSIPKFIPDSRKFILNTVGLHDWRVLREKPGEITLELLHIRFHARVLTKVSYSPYSLRIELISAEGDNCVPNATCGADPGTLQRWLLTLRRDFAMELLYDAILNAGGTVRRVVTVTQPEDQ